MFLLIEEDFENLRKLKNSNNFNIILDVFVGNKDKGRISKRVFQESKARQNFRKTNISYFLIRTDGERCGK